MSKPAEKEYDEQISDVEDMLKRVRYFLGWGFVVIAEHTNKGYRVQAHIPSKPEDVIEDGFGSSWSAYCPECGNKSMHVVRPGKVQCSNCG